MRKRLQRGGIPTRGTAPERLVAALLDYADVAFLPQHRIGPYIVDFFLPQSAAVIEVDGVYWHPAGPDPRRDDALRANGVSFIQHITDMFLIKDGWL